MGVGRTAPELMGETDVLDLLVRQHHMIAELFEETERSVGLARERAFERLVRLLAVHESAEEEIVHPYVRLKLGGGDGVVDGRLDEERQGKLLLAHLEQLGPDHPDFLRSLRAVRAMILAHAEAEEREEFPVLRARSSEAERRALAAAVKAAEATGPTHPHPGVESATMNLLLGVPLALVDRTRDVIRKLTGKRP
ncbi:hemerythrin domain-containing protein [Sphaerisporangium fuscum]|uniref:hemerythrin domain-containing protein n=1 Tax=Sphaerisporangium fuscum TaxID=2835868 RepID=UPI0020299A2E|nr:hemerythrin domain-containing protein [Sphaerisporangium fuscum]